jgi:cystathionine beta-lyase/cystathionine gamma-synthase
VVPAGGRVVYDAYIYYEVERELIFMAAQNNWEIIKIDLTDLGATRKRLQAYSSIDLFFYDTPRNWWLDSLDAREVAEIAKEKGATIVVDISVQPLRQLLEVGCADVAVCSSSKYPSLGLAVGGVILSDNEEVVGKCRSVASREGHVLSPDAATTIWSQAVSLRDRLVALSIKAERIASFLRGHGSVRTVRIPNKDISGGLVGGQISFHPKNANHGALMEEIIGQNSLSQKSALYLACTFGASVTIFERFASSMRHRTGIPREATNEVAIPDDIVRLGIGCEHEEDIINELEFLLNIASTRP